MAQHIIGFVSGGHAAESEPGVDSNARMTALLGVCLLVAFGIESITVIDVGQMFTWHVFVGLFIVPLVCFKLATTGYRFWHYYRGAEAYRSKGAPHPILRISAPLLVVATLSMLGAGIVTLAVGPRHADTWLTIHQGTVIAWAVLISVHVVGHALETWRLTTAEVRAKPPIPRRSLRLIFVAVSLAIGLIVGVASLGWTSAWRNRSQRGDGLAPTAVLVAR
ncbi:MAG: hypothetical protein ABI706_11490 [Ilumatobacteraceae bacterium]